MFLFTESESIYSITSKGYLPCWQIAVVWAAPKAARESRAARVVTCILAEAVRGWNIVLLGVCGRAVAGVKDDRKTGSYYVFMFIDSQTTWGPKPRASVPRGA